MWLQTQGMSAACIRVAGVKVSGPSIASLCIQQNVTVLPTHLDDTRVIA